MGVVDTDLLLIHRSFRWIPEDLWDTEQRMALKDANHHTFGPFAKVKYLHRGQLAKRWLESHWLLVSNEKDVVLVTLQYQDDLFSRGLVFFHATLPNEELFREAAVLLISAFFLKRKSDRLDVLAPAPHLLSSLPLPHKVWQAPVSWDAPQEAFHSGWYEQKVYSLTQADWWALPEAMKAHEQLSFLVKRVKNKESLTQLKEKRAIKKRPRGWRSLFRPK